MSKSGLYLQFLVYNFHSFTFSYFEIILWGRNNLSEKKHLVLIFYDLKKYYLQGFPLYEFLKILLKNLVLQIL